MLQFTRKRYKNVTNKKIDKSTGNWGKVLDNKGTHSQKMIIWRNAIELRRAYREYSTEVCLKALVSANGDLTKAITLLGGRDFGYQAQYGAPLAEEIKDSLNPYTRSYNVEDSIDQAMVKIAYSRSSQHGSTGRRAHRHLQESLHSTNSAVYNLISPAYDLENIVLQSYFSKNCVQVPAPAKKGRPKSGGAGASGKK